MQGNCGDAVCMIMFDCHFW